MDQMNRKLEENDAIANIPLFHRHSIVHFRQRHDWDCGIACVIMILSRQKRQTFLQQFNEICEEEGFGKSVWTIDLCYLLHRFNVPHKYTTITIGVNPSFSSHDYYESTLCIDHKRVNSKFDEASTKGWDIQKRTVDNQTLLEHLAKHGPLIVLTNSNLLQCDICKTKHSEVLDCLRKYFTRYRRTFSGHFIVVCGYDNRIGSVFYRNPSVDDDHFCVMSYRKLTEARTASGTDEDVIFIFSKS